MNPNEMTTAAAAAAEDGYFPNEEEGYTADMPQYTEIINPATCNSNIPISTEKLNLNSFLDETTPKSVADNITPPKSPVIHTSKKNRVIEDKQAVNKSKRVKKQKTEEELNTIKVIAALPLVVDGIETDGVISQSIKEAVDEFIEENKLNLTIEPKANILCGIQLYEYVDMEILELLNNSHLLQEKFSNDATTEKYSNELAQLLKYKSKYNTKKTGISVVYNRARGYSYGRSNPAGALSLFQIRRIIRKTLGHKYYYDFDVENCHPVVLLQICKANNIPCEQLEIYVLNRNEYLTDAINSYGITRDEAKTIYLSYLNGGTFTGFVSKQIKNIKHEICELKKRKEFNITTAEDEAEIDDKINILNDKIKQLTDAVESNAGRLFYEEIQRIHKVIAEANPHLLDEVKKNKIKNKESLKNLNGSVCSFFLQEYEIRILEVLFLYCRSRKLITDVGVLCADGLMLLKELVKQPEKLLIDFNKVVYDELGFDLKFTVKKLDDNYYTREEVLKNQIITDEDAEALINGDGFNADAIENIVKLKSLPEPMLKPEYDDIFDKKHDLINGISTYDYATKFVKKYGDKFLYVEKVLYSYTGIYWKQDEGANFTTLQNLIATEFHDYLLDDFYKYDKYENSKLKSDDGNSEHKKTVAFFRNQLFRLKDNAKRQYIINDIINQITKIVKFDEDPYLIAFNNIIFDIRTGDEVPPKPEQYISITTGYDYTKYDYGADVRHAELMKLIDEIFYNEPRNRDLYLTILSTGLCGVPTEYFIVANGVGGNGKGVINDLFLKLLGDYGYILPASVITNKMKTGSNPELASINKKRFVLAREPDKDTKINAGLIKELTGGGETINARMNYSNKTTTYNSMTLALECNEKPALGENTDAIMRRLLDIPFKSLFVKKARFDDDTKFPIEVRYKGYYPIDYYYKTNEFKIKYRQSLFDVLIKYFIKYYNNNCNLIIPEEIDERNAEYLQSSNEFYGWVAERYTNTKVLKKYSITINAIFTEYKNSEYYSNLTKRERRELNYKKFIQKFEADCFLKPFISEYDKVKILLGFTPITEPQPTQQPNGLIITSSTEAAVDAAAADALEYESD